MKEILGGLSHPTCGCGASRPDPSEDPRFRSLASYFRERFGVRVYKVALDAGFSCPNRDGTKGIGGCIYCNNHGSRAPYVDHLKPVDIQLKDRIAYLRQTHNATKFIAYLQAFSNTYGPIERLRQVYESLACVPGVVGLSVGTRPDTADPRALDLIASYRSSLEVSVEYGLQSSHDRSLRFLKRMHTVDDFTLAASRSKQRGLRVAAHIIIGIPGETRLDVIGTALYVSSLAVDEVKIHPLHVLAGSDLEKLFSEGLFTPIDAAEYVGLVCDFLENLDERIVIGRLTGQGTSETHVAPAWALDKNTVISNVIKTMRTRGTRQGSAHLKNGKPAQGSHDNEKRLA